MNFKKFAKEKFAMVFPKNVVFEEKKEGVRAFVKTLMPIDIKGKRGILVYTNKPTNAFARTFGGLATKNKISVSEIEAKQLVQNKKIKSTKNLTKNDYFIVFFKNHPIAVVFYDGKFLIPTSGKKIFITNNIGEKLRKI